MNPSEKIEEIRKTLEPTQKELKKEDKNIKMSKGIKWK